MENRKTFPAFCLAVAAGLTNIPASGSAADFYAGKTVTLLVSSEAGGGYDVYARLLSRHLSRHIPGAPNIIVQNEPGAGGLRAAQELYSVVVKDGTQIGYLRGSTLLDSILGIRGAEIDPNKYQWIGNMADDTDLCTFWHTSGVHSFDDLKNWEVLVGAAGYGSQGYTFPNAINHILHTKMKIITGYQGTGDRMLAAQRGELDGSCGMNASTVTGIYPQMIADGQLIPVIQSGIHPHPAAPNIPLTQSFATTDDQRRLLTTIFSQMDVSRVFAVSPGVPPDRVHILRKAFMDSVLDPQLVDDAKKQKLDINPMSGEEVSKIVAQMANLSAEAKSETRTALGE